MSKRRALKFSGVSAVENIVGFVVLFFTESTQQKMTQAKQSSFVRQNFLTNIRHSRGFA